MNNKPIKRILTIILIFIIIGSNTTIYAKIKPVDLIKKSVYIEGRITKNYIKYKENTEEIIYYLIRNTKTNEYIPVYKLNTAKTDITTTIKIENTLNEDNILWKIMQNTYPITSKESLGVENLRIIHAATQQVIYTILENRNPQEVTMVTDTEEAKLTLKLYKQILEKVKNENQVVNTEANIYVASAKNNLFIVPCGEIEPRTVDEQMTKTPLLQVTIHNNLKQPIQGISYQLLNKEDKIIATGVTNEQGISLIKDIPDGDYFFKEINKVGEYKQYDEKIPIKITKNDTVIMYINKGEYNIIEVTKENQIITYTDKKENNIPEQNVPENQKPPTEEKEPENTKDEENNKQESIIEENKPVQDMIEDKTQEIKDKESSNEQGEINIQEVEKNNQQKISNNKEETKKLPRTGY